MPASRCGLGRLAAFVVRRRRAVVLTWVAALVAGFGAMGLAGDWAADYNTPSSESKAAAGTALLHLADRASRDGVRVRLGGNVIQNAQQGASSSEAVGLAIAAGILVLTFGSLVAAGLPLAAALFGLGISSALVGLLAAVTDVPDWAPAMPRWLDRVIPNASLEPARAAS